MKRNRRVFTSVLALLTVLALAQNGTNAQSRLTIDQYLAPGYPFELVAAKKADRIAWLAFERGDV